MITILYWSNYATFHGGGQRSLWYLLRDLDRSRYRPVLVCPTDGELTALARLNDIPVEILPLPRLRLSSFIGCLSFIYRLRELLRRYRVDVIHSEELTTLVLASVITPFTGTRLIWHVRVLWDTPFQKRLALRLADRIICVSQAVADSFPSQEKVVVAHNGIDCNEYSPAGTPFVSDKFSEIDTLIGYFASLEPHKNARVLIEAFAAVAEEYPAVKLLLAGKGTAAYEKALHLLVAQLHLERSVIFWGEEYRRTKELMNRINIFVLPSLSEGLSRSLMEAMALEKPIVASNIPQNAELIIPGKTGLLAIATEPRDFAEKILSLLDNPAYARELGANAREHVRRRFALTTTTDKICAVYNDLFGEKA